MMLPVSQAGPVLAEALPLVEEEALAEEPVLLAQAASRRAITANADSERQGVRTFNRCLLWCAGPGRITLRALRAERRSRRLTQP